MRIGYIGLGAMGRPMAVNITEAGHEVVVFDLNENQTKILAQRGATVARSAKEVADEADYVLTCLPSIAAAEAVALGKDGVIAGSRAKAFVNMGTTGSAFARSTAEAMNAAGKAYLDAPISGGPPGAEAGTLGVMCSGDRSTFEALKDNALEAISAKLVYLGEKPGAAQVMKLVNNIIFFGNVAVAMEALTLGAKAGLSAEQMLEVINASSGRNTATEWLIPNHVLNRAFDFGGANYIIAKDLDLWRQEVEAFETPMQLGVNMRTLYLQSMWKEGMDADITTLLKTLEEIGNTKLV
ncbi:MAG: NAD(P)-dependent oxidoreductase [Alphaproteobacteria bacterium]|jgi:3-hydroxyisobutyrate dehydrogenase-like beta-hydroxyacid dehydrogenase